MPELLDPGLVQGVTLWTIAALTYITCKRKATR